MKLQEYLDAIKECPDEVIKYRDDDGRHCANFKLTLEYDIYDNYPIFLNADHEKIAEELGRSGKFERFKQENWYGVTSMNYAPGTVEIRVNHSLPIGLGTYDLDEKSRKHYEIQKRDYNIGIVVYPYQKKRIEGVDQFRAIAMAIGDISRTVIIGKVKACFPRSIGWNYSRDYSRIVYYDPVEDVNER